MDRRALGTGAHADDSAGRRGDYSFRRGHSCARWPDDGIRGRADADPAGNFESHRSDSVVERKIFSRASTGDRRTRAHSRARNGLALSLAFAPAKGGTSRRSSGGSGVAPWPFAKLGIFHSLRPLLIGIVHGLAGSAAVALLVLTTIHDPRWGVFYLLIFGLGTIAGMMLITVALALPFSYAGTRFAWVNRGLGDGVGIA